MGIFNRLWAPQKGSNRSGMVHMTGSFTTTTSGAIASSDTPGFTITKTGSKAGRYRVQLVETDGTTAAASAQAYSGATAVAPWAIQAPHAVVCSPAADAALTQSLGFNYAIRNFTPASGYFDFQFYKSLTSSSDETHTDVEVETGSVVLVDFWVKTSSVVP
jgi:hypothetical protein